MGSFVLTAAYAIGAEPEPASLDCTERLNPIIIVPITPPTTDCGIKASFIITYIACGMC